MQRESIVIMTLVLALTLIGVFMVFSASAVDSHADARFLRELIYVGLGMITLYVMAHFDYHHLRSPIIFRSIVLFSLLLLVAVLIPGIGEMRLGARRWLEIAGVSFQPSEFAKLALILLLAVKLSNNQEDIKGFSSGFLPPVLLTFLFTGLILGEKDLGTPVVLTMVAFVMMFIAGVRWRYLLPSVLPVIGIIYALSITSPHRVRRLMAFVDPWRYQSDEGYQLVQSMTAFAVGSIWGRGPGAGEQKLGYLPEAHTDFIFAVWAEEMGLVGTLTLVTLFVVLLVVSLRIAICARDLFGTLLAGGIIALVAIQAGVNMSVTTGLLPTKGLPLPFISWGGSALLTFMLMMGILINIGLQAEAPERGKNIGAAQQAS